MEADVDPTQCTQRLVDPRRLGLSNSGLSSSDIADVICILHPCSPAAFDIAIRTAQRTPEHVLQNAHFDQFDDGLSRQDLEEQETFVLEDKPKQAVDLALRFSSTTKNPVAGFVFGRNQVDCDIVMNTDTAKRVSNMHFRIFVTHTGICMLQDTSTNGTLVDEAVLRGKGMNQIPQTRMLNAGSIIQILSPKVDEVVKFIVRIPSREGHIEEYAERFQAYMQNLNLLHAQKQAQRRADVVQQPTKAGPAANLRSAQASISQHLVQKPYGMQWNGAPKYNVAGLLGKGAFAAVYLLATKTDGQLFAAKELEKRRFIKNGVLDRKLDNEMQIMKTISHPNIVQYVDYFDHDKHLYIIMEYVGCGDLQQYLAAHQPLSEELAKVMARQVFEAMAYLHAKKITHRDIKPDNILIADKSAENFVVKLSDFGLSKVVKDNDTFLKTFCGTLLYCAPEVFPHYDAHVAAKSKKRARRNANPQEAKFHSYSQSVDIWSFGAVLWYALCNQPPFEGVLDHTGRGMFEKIMMTPLNPYALQQRGISNVCIGLLLDMLNTDPALRPSPRDCLQHSWFAGLGIMQHVVSEDDGLNTIVEEEEVDPGAEPDMSQLRIHEENDFADEEDPSFDSAELEYQDPRQSKRIRYQDRSSYYATNGNKITQSATQFITRPTTQHGSYTSDDRNQERLFGEITESQLQDAAYENGEGHDHPKVEPHASCSAQIHSRAREEQYGLPSTTAATQWPQGDVASNVTRSPGRPDSETTGDMHGSISLMGAESLVRELNMESPQSGNSLSADEPQTPKTPEEPPSSVGQKDRASQATPTKPQEKTPKQSPFDRQIRDIPLTVEHFWDANDPKTHTLEYASLKSGHDFVSNPTVSSTSFSFLPSTTNGTPNGTSALTSATTVANLPQLNPSPEFARPAPRLGRLTPTADSFSNQTIHLTARMSAWGRAPNNTVVYGDAQDTRVAKRGIVIYFDAPGVVEAERSGKDWTKLKGLHCVVSTESRRGIFVNGIKLEAKNQKGKVLYGKVYTGDIILTYKGEESTNGTGLSFVCEFFHGEGKSQRPSHVPPFEVLSL